MNTAIILIPIIIWDLNIRKNFKEDKNQLKDLKMKLINIRYEMVYKLIEKLKDENEKSKLLEKFNLKKYKNAIILDNPHIINDVSILLRKFNLYYGDNNPYADVFLFMARYDRFLDLNSVEDIIYDTIVLLTKYGEKDEYEQLEKGIIARVSLENINKDLEKKNRSALRILLLWDLFSVLLYIHHKFKPDRIIVYKDGQKSDMK